MDRRDFYQEMEMSKWDESFYRPDRDFDVVAGDSGPRVSSLEDIRRRTPATRKMTQIESYRSSITEELAMLESQLSEFEFQQYLLYREEFNNDSERIYFLRLPSNRERVEYMQARGMNMNDYQIAAPSRRTKISTSQPLQSQWRPRSASIQVGLSKEDVMAIYGEPRQIEVAGPSYQENERWLYERNGASRYIYFEAGRVQAWDKQ